MTTKKEMTKIMLNKSRTIMLVVSLTDKKYVRVLREKIELYLK